MMPSELTPTQFTYAFAKDKGLVVLSGRDRLTVAVRQGADPLALIEARRALGDVFAVEAFDKDKYDQILAEAFATGPMADDDIDAAVESRGGLESLIDDLPKAADLLDGQDDAPVIRLINGLIHEAIKRRASDIHIDPFENNLSIRYRIDGDLVEVLTPPESWLRRLSRVSRSWLGWISRRNACPSDGRISLSVGGRSIDVRVATLPTRYGERVVLRLLDTKNALVGLTELGMDEKTLERFSDALAQPNGVILVTGPVGSGKTTTLYASLSRLNNGRDNIMTLEDPVEYGLPGISQTQMDHKVGLNFAATLRSILRQDPNVVMVGEIRDSETAEVAFEFASTGRLALSTLHTNSAAGAITRLRDMGVEAYLLASTLRAVMAQRLVRRLCPNCKTERPATGAELEALGFSSGDTVMVGEPNGCFSCGNTGFDGRIGIYELLTVDHEIRDLLGSEASEHQIDEAAFSVHDRLIDNARRYVVSQDTSPAEVLRVCRKGGA